MKTINPLLVGKDLPPFHEIQITDIKPAIQELLEEARADLKKLESTQEITWQSLIEPLNKLQTKLNWSWGIISHLMGVQNTPELRQVHEELQPEIIRFYNDLGQNIFLYKAFRQLQNSQAWSNYEPAQRRIIESSILNFELSGIALPENDQEHFNNLQLQLGELSSKFADHVLDSTKAYELILENKEDLAGLPESLVKLAAKNANSNSEEGPWKMTLDYPCYIPFMQNSQKPDLREKLYRAFISRASSGDFDNHPLLEQILTLRQEQAILLGFKNYAELSLQN